MYHFGKLIDSLPGNPLVHLTDSHFMLHVTVSSHILSISKLLIAYWYCCQFNFFPRLQQSIVQFTELL